LLRRQSRHERRRERAVERGLRDGEVADLDARRGPGCFSFALSRLMSSLLFGVGAADPLTYVLVAATLVSAAVVASWLPARRASAVEPMDALRAE
jgi:hypothetical protein